MRALVLPTHCTSAAEPGTPKESMTKRSLIAPRRSDTILNTTPRTSSVALAGPKRTSTARRADFTKALRINPQSADAYHNRAIARVHQKRYRRAISDCTKAIRIDPKDVRTHNVRGVARKRLGKYREAISDYSEALRLEPESATRHVTLAWLLATCPDSRYRDGARAVELAERACELTDYADTEYLSCLAAAYAQKGDFGQAVAWQQKALELSDAEARPTMQWHLDLYQEGKPYHELW